MRLNRLALFFDYLWEEYGEEEARRQVELALDAYARYKDKQKKRDDKM